MGLRAQLIAMMSAVVVLALTVAVSVTLFVAKRSMYAHGLQEAVVRAQAFAYRAGFATLVARDDPQTAAALLQEVMAAPDTLAVELIDVRGVRLALQQQWSQAAEGCESLAEDVSEGRGELAYQDDRYWCVSVPVLRGTVDAETTMLGRLRVVSTTSSVDGLLRRFVFYGWMAGLLILVVAIVLIVRIASRLADPMQRIVASMRAIEDGGHHIRAPVAGPFEVAMIAKTYNRLMDRLDHQSAELERQVEQRTGQLQVAMVAAQAGERAKSAFLANVSHEMKTPIHVIEAHARDVLGEMEFVESAARARDHIEVILSQSAELDLRLTQILAFARADAGGYIPTFGGFPLAEFAEDLRVRFEPIAKARRNRFEVSWVGDQACTDRDMLLQIVSNLVVNACKFTQSGLVRVCLRSTQTMLEVEIADTGCGIAAEALSTIWREFRQADKGRTRQSGGFGLGLAIVRRLTDLLGGEAQLTSEVGRGTRVIVCLPVRARVQKEGDPDGDNVSIA